MKQEKKHYFDSPENVGRVLKIFYIICGLLFIADLIYHRHRIHAWEGLIGFYAIYGFIACVILVLLATQMRKLLMRDEDYYDDQ